MSKTITRFHLGFSLALLAGCAGPAEDEVAELLDQPSEDLSIYPAGTSEALSATMCSGSGASCENCDVDVRVGHVVFVHGYSSDQGAFGSWYDQIKAQNDCAGYKTYKVSIGQEAKRILHAACNPGFCQYDVSLEHTCAPNQYDPMCIGHCSSWSGQSCTGYDRTKNGICSPSGNCATYNPDDGARKHLTTWAEDLASFFANNRLNDLPDRSVTIVTHSTGAPAVANFMVRAYNGEAAFAAAARKVKRVINIQAALGGACGVSIADTVEYDDATSDLDDLQDGDIKYDFRKATFDGAVPWDHVQSKGEVGLFGDECEGMAGVWGVGGTGDQCSGTSHDGVTNNWVDNTSYRHPNGQGMNAGIFAYNINVHAVESKYCHTSNDHHPSYRSSQAGRFRPLFGTDRTAIDMVRNPTVFRPWWLGVVYR